MPSFVSADPELAAAMAKREGEHVEALSQLEKAMSESMNVEFVSTPVDRLGNPLGAAKPPTPEEAMEEAHRKRVLAGTVRAAGEEKWRDKPAEQPKPSLLVTLEHELSTLCMRLGELRANYMDQERQLMAQIAAKAGQVAMAKEMSR